MFKLLSQQGGHIDAIFFCPHRAEEDCGCRKPKPGMLKEIAHRFSINLIKVPAVGDSLRDLQAFDAAGAQPILVKTGKGEETLAKGGLPKNTWICENLAEAAQRIITEYV
jgi:D-glycero-D-manno-heptose 1,7-bisphosphate phosphatase